MEGIFLKHLFCQSMPLKWYLVFMIALDIFVVIADSLTIYSNGTGILDADTKNEQIGLIIAVVFFSIRVLIFCPILYCSLKLFIYDSRLSGKLLYGLKLAKFVLFLAFNIISVGFVMKDGCTAIHIKLPKMDSFIGQAKNYEDPNAKDGHNRI